MTQTGNESSRRNKDGMGKPNWLFLPWRDRNFILSSIFLIIFMVIGGSQVPSVAVQLPVRVLSIAFASYILLNFGSRDVLRVKSPLLLLAAMTALMILQLVPLPPRLWVELPGRARYLSLLELAGVADVWRPVSLTPDLTINSILATLPAFAALLVFGKLPGHMARSLLPVFISVCLCAALIGLLQAGSGEHFYLYSKTNYGSAVGFFANRNHQGFLLATVLPSLAVMARGPNGSGSHKVVFLSCAATTLALIPLVIITGSRGALALLLIGLMAAWLLYVSGRSKSANRRSRHQNVGLIVMAVFGAIVVTAVTISARNFAIQRLFAEDISQELRVVLFRPLLEIALTYLPFGTGFGSFVDVFRVDEPLWNVSGSYLNHAHNELLEVAIEGGIFGLAIILAFLFWYVVASAKAWRADPSEDRVIFSRLGSTVIGMLMLASLTDYPLRTPAMMVVFALSATWLAGLKRAV